MSELETRRVLVLSTAHLTPATVKMLLETPLESWPVAGGCIPHGFYIYAHSEQADGMSDDMWACLSFARERDFDYVQFDADAEIIEELPELWSEARYR